MILLFCLSLSVGADMDQTLQNKLRFLTYEIIAGPKPCQQQTKPKNLGQRCLKP